MWIAALLVALFCHSTSFAGEEGAPGAREPAQVMSYLGADWLERGTRFDEERPDMLLKAMGLEPGDVVADIGVGSGYHARPMAKAVGPEGKVYGVDIQPEMLEILKTRCEESDITNVVPVLSETADPKLPKGKIDWMLLVDVYHEFQEPEPMLAKLREALAPDGRVALAEYRLHGETAANIKVDHRMSPEQVMKEWTPAGFELVELIETLPKQHLFIFKKKKDDKDEQAK